MIRIDNYYTTQRIDYYLNTNNIGFIDNVRINRPFISTDFKNFKIELNQSKQATYKNVTLVNYKAKKDKNVFLISNHN